MSNRLEAVFRIVRPLNFIITFFTAVVAVIICSGNDFTIKIALLTGLSAAFTLSAGNIINDVFDVEIDKINRPHRPLAAGMISENSALVYYIILIFVSLPLAYLINLKAFAVVFFTTILLFVYSKYLKRIPLIGNIVVAFLTGLVFIYGGIASNNISAALIPAAFAILINFIREIVKDMQDIEGDKKAGVVSFPIKYGFSKSKYVILALTILLFVLTFYPFIMHLYDIEYFVIVMVIVNPLLIYSIKILFENVTAGNLNRVSSILKFNMAIGLIAIYIGV